MSNRTKNWFKKFKGVFATISIIPNAKSPLKRSMYKLQKPSFQANQLRPIRRFKAWCRLVDFTPGCMAPGKAWQLHSNSCIVKLKSPKFQSFHHSCRKLRQYKKEFGFNVHQCKMTKEKGSFNWIARIMKADYINTSMDLKQWITCKRHEQNRRWFCTYCPGQTTLQLREKKDPWTRA